jgi:hypothetical protein
MIVEFCAGGDLMKIIESVPILIGYCAFFGSQNTTSNTCQCQWLICSKAAPAQVD